MIGSRVIGSKSDWVKSDWVKSDRGKRGGSNSCMGKSDRAD